MLVLKAKPGEGVRCIVAPSLIPQIIEFRYFAVQPSILKVGIDADKDAVAIERIEIEPRTERAKP